MVAPEPLPIDWTGCDHVQLGQFLRARSTRTMVRSALSALLEPGARLGRCRWHRVKVKPGRRLTVSADVVVLYDGGASLRPVTIEWQTPTAALNEWGAGWPEPVAPGIAPFTRLVSQGPFSVRVSPYDPDFPNLARLLDAAAGPVGLSLSTPSQMVSATTVRYRPGQRHVLRFDGRASDGAPLWTSYAKLAPPGQGQSVAEAAARFAQEANRDRVLVVGPVGVLDDAVLYPSSAGVPLSRLAPGPGAGRRLATWLRCAGGVAAGLHGAPAPATSAVHTVERELAIAARAVGHVGLLAGHHRNQIAELVDRLTALASATDPGPVVALHGDLKLDHLHRFQGRLLVIDIDRAAPGEAAIDLGNLLADVRWWGRSLHPDQLRAAVAAVGRGYGGDRASSPRTRLMEAVGLLRIAGRRPCLTSRRWLQETGWAIAAVEGLVVEVERELT
jgi:Phosphotransferase enzyme family